VEIGEKRGQPIATPIHLNMAALKVGKPFLQKSLRKTPTSLCKVVEGSEIYNFGIHCSVHFSLNFWSKSWSH
jgi:hypothetical protein